MLVWILPGIQNFILGEHRTSIMNLLISEQVAGRKINQQFQQGLLIDTEILPLLFLQDGNKPIQLAATSGSRAAVEALLAVTPRIQSVPEWSVDGVIEFMQSEYRREQVFNLSFCKS